MEVIISYAYYETKQSMYNFDFFCQVGIVDDPKLLYIIVINGYTCSVEIPNFKNIIVIKRDNIGFDFGAHGVSITHLLDQYETIENIPCNNFMFINCSVIGPFLPSYYPTNIHWTNIFTSRLSESIKLVGTSLVNIQFVKNKLFNNFAGPNIEGFCFCLDKVGLLLVYNKGTVFVNHQNKQLCIHDGEFGLSNVITDNGYNIDCLLYKYENVDWTDKQNWIIYNNDHKFPSRKDKYDGISIHPFEVVFHKWYWFNDDIVNYDYVKKYKQWKLFNIHKNKNLFIYGSDGITLTKQYSDLYLDDDTLLIPKNIYCDVYIYGTHFSVIGDGCKLIINNKHNINATAEINHKNKISKIDFTYKFINIFLNEKYIKDNFLIIPSNYEFHSIFNNDLYWIKLDVTIKVGTQCYQYNGKQLIIPLGVSF